MATEEKANGDRLPYLIECFRSAHEELLARIRQREEWFKIGLATQVAILAAMSGLEVFGTKAAGTAPPAWLPLISMPISLIIVLLYSIEERMVGHLASYLSELPIEEAKVAKSERVMPTFNRSRQLAESVPGTLRYRGVTNIIAFIVLPSIVTFLAPPSHSYVERGLLWLYVPLAGAILWVIITSWRYRLSIVKPYSGSKLRKAPNTVGRADG